MNWIQVTSKLFTGCLGLLVLMGSDCNPPKQAKQKAEFETFGISPDSICTNLGLPIVRISWRVRGSGKTCLTNMALNGTPLRGDTWQGGTDQVCGEGNYSREVAFSLNAVFGNNIPSSINITADLKGPIEAGFQPDNTPLDSASATATTRECNPSIRP